MAQDTFAPGLIPDPDHFQPNYTPSPSRNATTALLDGTAPPPPNLRCAVDTAWPVSRQAGDMSMRCGACSERASNATQHAEHAAPYVLFVTAHHVPGALPNALRTSWTLPVPSSTQSTGSGTLFGQKFANARIPAADGMHFSSAGRRGEQITTVDVSSRRSRPLWSGSRTPDSSRHVARSNRRRLETAAGNPVLRTSSPAEDERSAAS
jgi:hypothetical protein